MIQLKVSRTNSIHGSWRCEEIGNDGMLDPLGISISIPDAIEDFLRVHEILKGFRPTNYKWSQTKNKS